MACLHRVLHCAVLYAADYEARSPGSALTTRAETQSLRLDYIGISSALSMQLWLWSSNYGWAALLPHAAAAALGSTVLVCLLAWFVPAAAAQRSIQARPRARPPAATQPRSYASLGAGNLWIPITRSVLYGHN